MKIKTTSDIDLKKRSKIVNGAMQTFSSLQDAEATLDMDGLFGYVSGEGVYLNITGQVNLIAPSTSTSSSNSGAFYQGVAPIDSDGDSFSVGSLWYNTVDRSLYIWTNTSWLKIGGSTQSVLLTEWLPNTEYVENQMVLYDGSLWYNSTGNLIISENFEEAEWTLINGIDSNTYELNRTQTLGSTIDGITLDGFGELWVINHNGNNRYPNIKVLKKSTREVVGVDITLIDENNISITLANTLPILGMDLVVYIEF